MPINNLNGLSLKYEYLFLSIHLLCLELLPPLRKKSSLDTYSTVKGLKLIIELRAKNFQMATMWVTCTEMVVYVVFPQ